MPRQLRIQYPGAMYHVMSRGKELCRLRWQETDLVSRPKHDPGKVQIALRLRRETTLSVKQIAQHLHFGTPKSASFRLLTVMRTQTSTDP